MLQLGNALSHKFLLLGCQNNSTFYYGTSIMFYTVHTLSSLEDVDPVTLKAALQLSLSIKFNLPTGLEEESYSH